MNQPKILLDRQPPEGKVRENGLRYGELEKNGYGCEDRNIVKSRMLDKLLSERSAGIMNDLKYICHSIALKKMYYLFGFMCQNNIPIDIYTEISTKFLLIGSFPLDKNLAEETISTNQMKLRYEKLIEKLN